MVAMEVVPAGSAVTTWFLANFHLYRREVIHMEQEIDDLQVLQEEESEVGLYPCWPSCALSGSIV